MPRLLWQVSESSGRGLYTEAVTEQKINSDVSATSITTRCLAGEKSPPPSLQGHPAQTGCVRGHPGEGGDGLGAPSGIPPVDWWFGVPCRGRCHREFHSKTQTCHSSSHTVLHRRGTAGMRV